jgi:rubrerythrin
MILAMPLSTLEIPGPEPNSHSSEGKAMKALKPFLRFSLVIVVLLPLLLWLVGCQQKGEQKPVEKTQQGQQKLATITNLQAAYGAELKHTLWYERFEKQAQKENLAEVAVLFRALGRSEKVHADRAAGLLKSKGVEPIAVAIDSIPPGKARQYLKLSISNENVEQNLYSSFVPIAQSEQFTEAAEWFKQALKAEARHGRLLNKAVEQPTNFGRLPYVMCPECGYIVGSDKIEECPICNTKKDKFQKI